MMNVSQPAAFQRILVPLDGSLCAEKALRYVKGLVRTETALFCLRVIEDQALSHDARRDVVASFNESSRRFHEYALRHLNREAGTLRRGAAGPSIAVEVIDGDPVERLLQAVERHAIDLIVMTSRGDGRATHSGLGRVVSQVASRSPVPVLIVRESGVGVNLARDPFRRIVVPLDGSDLSGQALQTAVAVATQFAIPIVLVTALDLASCGSPALAREAAYDQGLYRELFAEVEFDARRSLNRTAAQLAQQGLAVTSQLRIGPVAETILEAVEPGDLLVMTSRRRGGGRSWPVGSVAETLIAIATVPVLLAPTRSDGEMIESDTDNRRRYLPGANLEAAAHNLATHS